jgi:hypothetical protein
MPQRASLLAMLADEVGTGWLESAGPVPGRSGRPVEFQFAAGLRPLPVVDWHDSRGLPAAEQKALRLVQTIPLPGVKGRLDPV